MNAALPNGAGRVAFVVKGYPRLSETFIAQEIEALESRGLDILIVSLRRPTDPARHPVHAAIRAACLYLPEYLHEAAGRVWRGWRTARRLPGYREAWRVWRADLRRDFTPNRVRRFGQALVLAAELPDDVRQLHAHFLHTPASVARYAAMIRGLDWTVSAHAKDIWTIPDWEKREKLASASWAVTCTASGRQHLTALAASPDRVALCHHGLAFDRFPPGPPRTAGRDGRNIAEPVILLSVGRTVAKKGYHDLLAALALLPSQLYWRLVHIGGGALADPLKAEAARLGLADRIEWRGARPQPEVLAAYREADLFVLAAKIADDGDRDGLPNVLLEAQSQGLACIATALPGILEVVEGGRTGVIVPPGDPQALANALAVLIGDPQERRRLAAAGEAKVRRYFDMQAGIDLLAARFRLPERPPLKAASLAGVPEASMPDLAAPANDTGIGGDATGGAIAAEAAVAAASPASAAEASTPVEARPRRIGAAITLRANRPRES